jgi:hypothetical protein
MSAMCKVMCSGPSQWAHDLGRMKVHYDCDCLTGIPILTARVCKIISICQWHKVYASA